MSWPKVLIAVLFVAYPVFVYFGLNLFDTRTVALVIVCLALLRLGLVRGMAARREQRGIVLPRAAFLALGGALVLVGGWVVFSQSAVLLLYYPVLVNVVFFTFFFQSLFRPPTVVERIARLQTPDLPKEGVRYTRKVTMVWCGFFVFNGSLALATVLNADMKLWAVYNSAVSYGLMGILFVGEYIIRRRVQQRVASRSGVRDWS